MYQWVMRRKGFEVSDIGYFLYVDGLHVGYDGMLNIEDTTKAVMHFDTSIRIRRLRSLGRASVV